MQSGYFRYPTIFNDTIAFTSEDDVWTVPASGGRATRLTSTNGLISRPKFSPDGKTIAFSSQEEGLIEVYTVPAEGGDVTRLTYFNGVCQAVGWTPEGKVLFTSATKHAMRTPILMEVDPTTPHPKPLSLGPASSIDLNAQGWAVIERNGHRPDPAHWKRYRGGTAGQLWTSQHQNGDYQQILSNLSSNLSSPQWVGERLYFIADHEGWGNLYSCTIDGSDLKRHTDHKDYYARNLHGDGKNLVYHCGADVYFYDASKDKSERVEINYSSQRPQRQRKFVSPKKYWENFDFSPDGKRIAFGSRGQVFAFENWKGAVFKKGSQDSIRYRMARWLHDSKTVAVVSDHSERDQIELYEYGSSEPKKIVEGDFGNILVMKSAPTENKLAIANHRNEIIIIDADTGSLDVVMRNHHGFTNQIGFNWSPDSQWLTFGQNFDRLNMQIQVYNVKDKTTHGVTRQGNHFLEPVFDPKGEYLYYISAERLNPVYSDVMFDVSFPQSRIPCVVALKTDTQSPFLRSFDQDAESDSNKKENDDKEKAVSVEIDFENIELRSQSFPIKEGLYEKIVPAADGKVYYLSTPIKGSLDRNIFANVPDASTNVSYYDFKLRKEESFLSNVTDFGLCQKGKHQFVQTRQNLRLNKAGEKPDAKAPGKEFNSKTGHVDLSRVKVMVDPQKEWKQMYGEIWRLQRDHFWVEDMSKIDWAKVFDLYKPLLQRVGCRSEFSDLIWEMQGELGTSHAYEIGGDQKAFPNYPVGFLGADFTLNKAGDGYSITKVFDGAITHADQMSPLRQPGINVTPGDELISIDGVPTTASLPPESLLLNKAGCEVEVGIRYQDGKQKKFTVKALSSEDQLRYRDWVETNRSYVAKQSQGKLGYVHIPDMSPAGYAEFFRNYLKDSEKDGLVVDARYNGGGHVSQLILSYLSRRQIGFDQTRWIGVEAYPAHSPAGPMVALTNQYAGSDGDIFPHAFKLLGLGPVIGKRTWGGVIGIYPRNFLADGGLTTQPEFSHWFADVGWEVENHGTEPDIEVDITPQDYIAGKDPQLDRGIQEALSLIEKSPRLLPDWTEYPDLSLPGQSAQLDS